MQAAKHPATNATCYMLEWWYQLPKVPEVLISKPGTEKKCKEICMETPACLQWEMTRECGAMNATSVSSPSAVFTYCCDFTSKQYFEIKFCNTCRWKWNNLRAKLQPYLKSILLGWLSQEWAWILLLFFTSEILRYCRNTCCNKIKE